MKKIIFLEKKGGHYKEYADLIQVLCNNTFEIQNKFHLFNFLSAKKYIIIDGDTKYLLFALVSFFRSFFGLKTYFFSVRTEWIAKQSILSWPIILLIKLISFQKNTKYISIHKNNKNVIKEDKKHDLKIDYIFDPQLWDMPYLHPNCQPISIKQIDESFKKTNKPVLAIIGSLNKKRCSEELISTLDCISKEYHIVLAGKHNHTMISEIERYQNKNISLISKYLDIREIFWIYSVSDLIYAYYDLSVERPSGILGRGLQFGKKILVKKNGFLEGYFKGAVDMLAVENLSEIKNANNFNHIKTNNNQFSSKEDLLQILEEC